MITKKITKGMEVKLLQIMFNRYIKEHGYGTRNLKKYSVIITGGEAFVDDMPEIVEYNARTDTKRYLLLDILKELMGRGFIECSEDNTHYWLTKQGYDYASKTWLQRFMTYLNNNSGWAIPIALLSLMASITALFVNK
ncbi:hypothetical protein KO519_21020 [Paraglaciecola agarilytica]|uniref:hypothetical protein n=1 Tax=Paraglaciecola chathamensis TaxID=368405 RepID=UPI001C0A0D7C|nr:hypothetical protein [Paraglaciecola agarilytica]MBU3020160.1 hypothetical protein [Paraglaciecola agarilytica]